MRYDGLQKQQVAAAAPEREDECEVNLVLEPGTLATRMKWEEEGGGKEVSQQPGRRGVGTRRLPLLLLLRSLTT